MTATFLENFSIFVENLSSHYVGCVILSVLAVLITAVFTCQGTALSFGQKDLPLPAEEKQVVDPESEESDHGEARSEPSTSNGLVKRMKIARQEVIENKLTEGMSAEQLKEEKKAEEDQIAAIYNLLIQQEEKFQISSMEDVQSQLKLYRR